MLSGTDIIRITLILQLAQILQHTLLKSLKIIRMYAKEISLVIMLGPVSQHLLARRRLPPEHRRHIKTNQRTMAMRTHIHIFDSRIGKILAKTPAYAIHVILHGQFGPHPLFPELLDRSQRSRQSLLIGKLIKIQIHCSQFDTSLFDTLLQAFHLLGRTMLEVFTYRPRDFARPAELSIVWIVIRSITIIKGIVNIPKMLGQYLHLGAGISDIGMCMLHQIHLPMTDRLNQNLLRSKNSLSLSEGQRQAHLLAYLRNFKIERIRSFIQFHALSLLAQSQRHRERLPLVGNCHPYPLHHPLVRFIDRRIAIRFHFGNTSGMLLSP